MKLLRPLCLSSLLLCLSTYPRTRTAVRTSRDWNQPSFKSWGSKHSFNPFLKMSYYSWSTFLGRCLHSGALYITQRQQNIAIALKETVLQAAQLLRDGNTTAKRTETLKVCLNTMVLLLCLKVFQILPGRSFHNWRATTKKAPHQTMAPTHQLHS